MTDKPKEAQASKPPLRLSNPYLDQPCDNLVGCRVPDSIFQYFFRHVLGGTRGSAQNLFATFIHKFHQECLARGVAAVYDPDNERTLAQILNDLNFRPQSSPTPPRRRAPSGPPKRKGKPDVD